MRALGVGFSTIVVLGGLLACSSFTTTPADPPANDASVDTSPVSAEAGTLDAGTFCRSRVEPLCVDFEVDGIYGGDWAANNDTTPGQTVERVATMGKDSQASLHSTLPKGDGELGATLELGTDTIVDKAYLEADVYVKHPTVSFAPQQLTVISIQRGPDKLATDVEAKIVWHDANTYQLVLYAETSDLANQSADSAVVAFDTWVHVRLESDLLGSGDGRAAIIVNDGPATNVTVARRDVDKGEHTRAVVGLYRYTDTTPSEVELYVDDVLAGPLP